LLDSEMTKPIVVVGSINLDLVARAATIPRPGETLIGDSFLTFHGGKGANQAVAAARLGHPATMLGNVGEDSFGEELRGALRESGVSVEAIGTTPGASGVALILISAAGQNSIVVVPGANALLSPVQLERHAALLQGAGILLAQLEIPLESVEFLAAFAERNSIPFLLDPAPARDLPSSLLRRVTWLTPNETEADTLLDATSLSANNPIEAAKALSAKGPRNVILKLGSRGCILVAERQPPESIPAFVVNPVDTTAAGDAFAGGFAVALLRGSTPQEAARFASAVAAISVTRHGAQPSMPTNTEVLAFLKERS
jgi:ribokinase